MQILMAGFSLSNFGASSSSDLLCGMDIGMGGSSSSGGCGGFNTSGMVSNMFNYSMMNDYNNKLNQAYSQNNFGSSFGSGSGFGSGFDFGFNRNQNQNYLF